MPLTIAQLRAAREKAHREYTGPRVIFGLGMGPNIAHGIAVGEMGKHLRATSAVATQRAFEFGKQAGAGMWGGYGIEAPADAAVAMFAGPVDGRTCPFCRFMVGSRFKVGSDEYYRYMPPVHVNCVPAGTRVLTASGHKPIEQIVVGEAVLGHDGIFHRVTETMHRHVTEDLIEIETDRGQMLRLTRDHPVLTTEGWVSAGNVKVGDQIEGI